MRNNIETNSLEEAINKEEIYRAKLKIVVAHIFLSNILSFILCTILGQTGFFIVIALLYFPAFGLLYLGVRFGYVFLRIKLEIIYPIAFFISIIMLPLTLSWFNGNSILDLIKEMFFDRNHVFEITDPYFVGGILAYLGLFIKSINKWYESP